MRLGRTGGPRRPPGALALPSAGTRLIRQLLSRAISSNIAGAPAGMALACGSIKGAGADAIGAAGLARPNTSRPSTQPNGWFHLVLVLRRIASPKAALTGIASREAERVGSAAGETLDGGSAAAGGKINGLRAKLELPLFTETLLRIIGELLGTR